MVTTLGTIFVAFIAQKSGKGPFAKVEDATAWKDRAELEEVKRKTIEEKLAAEISAHADTNAKRIFAEREADSCERRLSAVYSELYAQGRLVDRRHVDISVPNDRREAGREHE